MNRRPARGDETPVRVQVPPYYLQQNGHGCLAEYPFANHLATRWPVPGCHSLASLACGQNHISADYDSSEQDFFRLTLSQQRRLRASVHSINSDFSNNMRTHGATVRIVSETDDEDSDGVDLETVALDQDYITQVSVTEAKFKEWVRQVNIIRAPIPQPLRTNS